MKRPKTAREKFEKGDRVKLSADGLAHLFVPYRSAYDRSTRGTVVGFGRQSQIVAVLRDGLSTRDAYHFMLWERATK